MKPYVLRALPMAMPKPVIHHIREPINASNKFLMPVRREGREGKREEV